MRSQRGDDVRAERCRRVGRDQAALGGVLGVHVVDFTWFLGGTDWINRSVQNILGNWAGGRETNSFLVL